MGRDKALVVHRGEVLAVALLRTLDTICDDVVVASGDGQRLAVLRRPQVADPLPERGPLAGLSAGLLAARHPLVAVLAVDLPNASAGLLRHLAAAWRPGDAAVVPRADGQLQPLHAIWARSSEPALQRRLRAGQLSVIDACDALTVRVMEVADSAFAHNLNRPEDLEPR
jgi:molybdopterin-guanine dinucleotide biosynthesis protein A